MKFLEMSMQIGNIKCGTKIKLGKKRYVVVTMPLMEKPKGWLSGFILEEIGGKT